jgi:signal transduction histidine kinase
VLQTLALVQRRANDPQEVLRLARRQERELRNWLLRGETDATASDDGSLGRALERVAVEVEEHFGVPVDVVRVRDCRLDDRLEPLVAAVREAATNAARHSGASQVAVYVEVEPQRVAVFVRDRGAGFDPHTVAADRRGVRESIVGRMERHGGSATIRSSPGEGTEIELVMPRIEEPAA